MSVVEELVLVNIRRYPGITALQLAVRMKLRNEPVYDCHRRISFAIARLRLLKLVEDVERCPHCGRALTRSHRNVPLHAIETETTDGINRRLIETGGKR